MKTCDYSKKFIASKQKNLSISSDKQLIHKHSKYLPKGQRYGIPS